MARILQFAHRRNTAATWASVNPVLGAGEPGWESDTGLIKYGDGTTAWNALQYTPGPIRAGYPPPSGGWAVPQNVLSLAAGGALVSGSAFFYPLDLGPRALQSLGVNVTTAQVGGTSTCTLGLYADDGSGGGPNWAAGPVVSGTTVLTATGKQTATISYTPIPGRYWTAFLWVASVAPSTFPVLSCSANATSIWCSNGLFLTIVRALTITGLSSLPNTAQTPTGVGGTTAPVVAARAA